MAVRNEEIRRRCGLVKKIDWAEVEGNSGEVDQGEGRWIE